MDLSNYITIDKKIHGGIMERYARFVSILNDVETEPVKVFDSLPKRIMEELEMIREMNKHLQKKKEEDLMKAAQAAEQAVETKNVAQESENKEVIEEATEKKDEATEEQEKKN